MTDLERQVLDLLRLLGYRTAHFRSVLVQTAKGPRYMTPVSGDGKGFPDVVACGRGRVVFLELKSGKGRLSPEQRLWRDELQAAGADWLLVGDDDLTALAQWLQS